MRLSRRVRKAPAPFQEVGSKLVVAAGAVALAARCRALLGETCKRRVEPLRDRPPVLVPRCLKGGSLGRLPPHWRGGGLR